MSSDTGRASASVSDIDPTTLAVLRRSLITIANEMALTIAKVSYSPVISEGRDFTGAIFDAEGHLVACGDYDLPGLLGTLEPTLEFVRSSFGADEIHEGDIIVCNSPHEAGTHLNDVRLVKPVFSGGELAAFVADLGHWTDVGGSVPGSINPLARDAYAEGLRITPVKIVDRGTHRRDVVEMILANVRLPYEANGDLWAQIKALDLGEARLHALFDRWGAGTVVDVFGLMQDHAEALFYARIDQIPDGSVEFEDFMDVDPLDPEQRPVHIHLRLTKEGRRLVFDLRGSDPQPKGGNGSPRPITQSGVYIATMNLFPGLPFNHGLVRNLEILTAPGTAVHVTFPNPVSGCAAGAFEKVIACVLGCWGLLVPERQVGSTFNLINVTLGGRDRRFDRPFVMYMWNEGGLGGGPDRDGGDSPGMSLFSPGSHNQPVELHERLFPIRLRELEIATDSAGAGRWRGCPGIRHSYEVLDADAVLGVFGDRHRFKPWGVVGGQAGAGQTVFINRGQTNERELGVLASDETIVPGDVVEVWSSGGGGYADPRTRDPDLVLRDVVLGFVSREAARDVYCVEVVCDDELADRWHIDERATATLRA